MALANLLWQHPTGDPVWVPCSHLSLTQTGSFSLDVPTKVDLEPLHQPNDGMTPLGPIPCIHLKPVVTMSTTSIPKYEVTAQHPNGHDSGTVAPCAHPMLPCLVDTARGLMFFTDDAQFQQVTVELVDDLRGRLHVRTVGAGTRPLLLFFREAVRGNADDDTDPFWSHYDPALHAIQITRRPGAVNYDDVRSTLRHELGHAIVGQSCVQVPNEGDPHSLKRPSHPGEAMSEGWAEFVRACLRSSNRTTPGPALPGRSSHETRDTSVPMTKDIEYNVLCVLWDLYDVSGTRVVPRPPRDRLVTVPDDDPASDTSAAFGFEELFGIFSPSLDTLPAGPVIWDIDDYLGRLKSTYPARASIVDAVRALHLGR